MILAIKIVLLFFAVLNHILAHKAKDEIKKGNFYISSEIYLVALLLSIIITYK